MRFLPKIVSVYSKEKEEFDCKNNYGYGKFYNFYVNNISKMNCKTLVVLLYTSSELG